MNNNTRPTASAVRALVVSLLAIKRVATPEKAAWIESRIDVALGSLLRGQIAAAHVTATAALRDAT